MTYNPSTAYFIHAVSADGSEHAETRFKFSTPSIYDGNGSYAYYTEPLSFFVFSFASDETIHLIWNYQQPGQFIIGTAVADSTGSASFYPTTPSTPDQSTVILAAVGVTSGLVVTTNLNNHPAIFMQPTTGKAGTKVTITGGSYGSSEPLTIMFGSASVANVTSNPDGTFTASFTAPKVTGAGNITVQVTGQTSGISLSLLFAYTPDMKVTPNVASFGDTVTVMGKHFAANSSITLSLPGNEYPGIMVGTDANGTFSASIPVTQQNFVRGTNDIGAFDVTTGATSSAVLMVQ